MTDRFSSYASRRRHHRRRRGRASASPGGWPRAALPSPSSTAARPARARATPPPACSPPAAEAEPGEEALVALGRDSQARWPAFAAELQAASGIDVELRTEGTLVVALDRGRPGAARIIISSSSRSSACRCNGFRPPRPAGASRTSPASSPARSGARRTIRSTTASSPPPCAWPPRRQARPSASTRPSRKSRSRRPRADGVVLADGTQDRRRRGRAGGRRLVAQHRRACAGIASAGAADQGTDAVAAHGPGSAADQPRAVGAGRLSGAAPRWPADRRRHRRGKGLRHHAHRRRPAQRCSKPPGARCRRSRNCRSTRCGSAIAPAAATTHRSSGRARLEGLIYATGHHRNGILLAPVTADTIARLVLDGAVDPAIRPFGIERFAPARAAE